MTLVKPLLVISTLLFVAACAQAPAVPTAEQAIGIAAPASPQAEARESLARGAQVDFVDALEAGLAGQDAAAEPRMELALGQLREAATACSGAQPPCDPAPFLDAYESLLRWQAERLLGEARALAEPVNDDQRMSGERPDPSLVTRLPEAGRSINLINGEELRQIIELNGPVKAALADWLTWMRPNLMEAWENYHFMRHLMWPHYEEAGLPEALLFGILATESTGKVHAVSRAGASGPLQFMPATGRRYGLEVVNGFDQRFDPSASTRANVAYLNDQFRLLNNNLELVLGAYNGGENRMRRLVQSTGKNRFWDDKIYWQLPRETREYVPKVLAAAWLFMHPEDYRVEFPAADHSPAIVALKREAALTELSICLGQEGSRAGWFRVLRNLNPAMNHSERQPPGTQVAMPAKLATVYERDCVDGHYQQLAQALHGARGPAEPATRQYVVKKGDTLSSIARQVRCANVQQLASLNKIPPPNYPLRVGQQLQIPSCS
jgi:membrane-bound lytic murein transglycosylase D